MTCVFSVTVLCLWFLSACDAVKDTAGDIGDVTEDVVDIVDGDFEKDFTISLNEITVQKADPERCGTKNVESSLKKLENKIPGLTLLDIDSVSLNYVNASYDNASWTPATETLTCRLTITGTQSIEIAETDIDSASGIIDVTLTDEQISVINYYLSNRNEDFTYCLACDDGNTFDAYSVTYSMDLNVLVKGSL